MVRGLFTAYTGMANEQKRLDIISNNMANAATIGFKEDNVTNQSFNDILTLKIKDGSEAYNNRAIGNMSLGVKLGEVYTNHGQGSLRETGNKLDIAIEGKGFFHVAVSDSAGNVETQYTRNGSFSMTRDGYLVDKEGNYVLGESGEVIIPTDAVEILVDETGALYADGVLVDRLLVTDFSDYSYLVKTKDTMYQALEGATEVPTGAALRQGYTEQSNVNVVSEMIEMITVTRAYEANQKVIKSIDQTLDLAANSVGKV